MQKDNPSFQPVTGKAGNLRLRWLLILCSLISAFTTRLYAADLSAIRAYFISGDYRSCIREGEGILAAARSSKGLDELYCILGLSYLKDGNYLRASDIFEIVLHEYKDSLYADEARLGLGDSYFLRSEFGKARTLYEALLKDYKRTKFKAGVYYRLSLLGKRTHDSALEEKYRDKLKSEFPHSPEAMAGAELFPAGVAFTPRAPETPKPVRSEAVSVPAEPSGPAGKVDAPADVPVARVAKDEVQSLTLASGSYCVQVGAFSSRANAQSLARKLNTKGYPSFIVQSRSNGRPLFKVRVGHFVSLKEAQKAETELRRADYPTKIIP